MNVSAIRSRLGAHPRVMAGALAALALAVAAERLTAPPQPLFAAPYSSVIVSREGTLLGAKVARDGQWRFPRVVRTTEVPPRFAQALILAEDRRFLAHPGVDPLALVRALRLNLEAGRVVSGGSTLTMQLVRLARRNPPRTLPEKLLEMGTALRLDATLEKDEILALYAAHAPFGGNVVGLEAAAWRHFGRPAAALTWAEAALLAVLPRAPSQLHPGRNRDRLRSRRDALLRRLHEQGRLDAQALSLALHEPLPEQARELPSEAPHLFETLIAERPERARIESTLDAKLQRRIRERTADHARSLGRRGIHNVAALVIDNATFEVRAYVGNSDATDGEIRANAVDVVRRPRSTGSILKPFLYAAMLEDGSLLPSMLVPDLPTQFGGYRPENFDQQFRGAVPAGQALARSLNAPAILLLSRYGVARFQAMLRTIGMTTLIRAPRDYGLPLIVGGAEGTLWDIGSMYANLAHVASQNVQHGSIHYRTVRAERGEEKSGPLAELGPGAAWLTLHALLEGEQPEGSNAWRRFASVRPVAWKTGTSYGQRDAWAVGVTANVTIAVWTGNASGEGVPGLTGVDAAAPLLFALFEDVGEVSAIPKPVEDLRPVEVCNDDGYLATPSCPSHTQWIPLRSRFTQSSPYHKRVYLDESGGWQVHAGCESLERMTARDWFVLPPSQEHFYRKTHADYRALPSLRPDCRREGETSTRAEIELIYPSAGSRLYIPVDLEGEKSRAVLEAVHRRSDATLYWHLDGEYLGQTKHFHRWPLIAAPGPHQLTLIDDRARSLERRFEILGPEQRAALD